MCLNFLSSCKKEKGSKIANSNLIYGEFLPFQAGSYWIYDVYRIYPDGTESIIRQDSVYVEGAEIINDKTYFKFKNFTSLPQGNSMIPDLIRDSLHYLVKSNGQIIFSQYNFSDIFFEFYENSGFDTISYVTGKMTDNNFPIQTDAGIFVTTCFQYKFEMYPNWNQHGEVRYRNIRYAKNVGIVKCDLPFFPALADRFERRLVRYFINHQL